MGKDHETGREGDGKILCISKRHVYTKNKAGRLSETRLTYQDTVGTATVCLLGLRGLLR